MFGYWIQNINIILDILWTLYLHLSVVKSTELFNLNKSNQLKTKQDQNHMMHFIWKIHLIPSLTVSNVAKIDKIFSKNKKGYDLDLGPSHMQGLYLYQSILQPCLHSSIGARAGLPKLSCCIRRNTTKLQNFALKKWNQWFPLIGTSTSNCSEFPLPSWNQGAIITPQFSHYSQSILGKIF